MYVVDSGNNPIALVLSSGVEGVSGATGTSLGQFQGPINLGVGGRGIYVSDTGNNRVQEFDPIVTGEGTAPVQLTLRGSLSSEVTLSQPSAVGTIEDLLEEKIYIADTGHNRVVLVRLPSQDPIQTWNNMMAHITIGDLSGALSSFCSDTAEPYRQSFLSVGLSDYIADMNQIGSPAGRRRSQAPQLKLATAKRRFYAGSNASD